MKNLFKSFKYKILFQKRIEYKKNQNLYILKKDNTDIHFKTKKINILSNNYEFKDKLNELNKYGYFINLFTKSIDYLNSKDILPVVTVSDNNLDGNLEVFSEKDYNDLIKNRIYGKLKIDLTIVILNYNNKSCIFKCIDSLIKYNNYNYRILVVDNNSTDGSRELLKQKYDNSKNIKIILNAENGCSIGRNLGMKYVDTEYIMFLDSDQFACGNYWLDNYIYISKSASNFGALGWASGWLDKNMNSLFINSYFKYDFMPPSALYRSDIDYLGTGGMLLKSSVFFETDGFDLNYDPTGFEDTDMSLQILSLGYKIYFSPHLNIFHDEHQTTRNQNYSDLLMKNHNYLKNKWKKVKNR